jgi:hypothetical protein
LNSPSDADKKPGRREFLERAIFVLAAFFLLFVGGMLVARLGLFPYPIVDDAVTAARAMAIQMGWSKDTEVGATAADGERSDTRAGVTVHDRNLAMDGYTIVIAGNDDASANLIDMGGRVVHRWTLPLAELRSQFGEDRFPETGIGIRSFHLYPNGDLLVVLHRHQYTPYGVALVKLDKDSRVLWANLEHAHHDVTVGAAGLIYTISHAIREQAIPGLGQIKAPFLEDFVLVVSADGRTIKRLSTMEAFVDTPFANAIKQLIKSRDWKGDYFHVNAIEPYDTRNPIAILGKNQVLISVRNMDALATLDLASGKIAWLLQGGWQKQHDPDIVNGHILLFDNRGDFARGGKSRVLEFDPITQEIIWQASVGAGYELYSGWGSNQQVLPNGNVMIVESAPGRMLELTRDGKVAWEYYSTTRDEEGKFATALLEARRYAPDEITFELGGKIQPQATP